MNEALEILARLGTDNPPTLSELTIARDTIARELHRLRTEGGADLSALVTLRDAYTTAAQAVMEAETAEEDARREIDEILGEVPDPDAEPAADPTGDEPAGDEPDPDAEPAEPTARVLSVREAVARLGLTDRPAASAADAGPDDLALTQTRVYLGDDVVDSATWLDVAKSFQTAGRSAKAGRERVVRIETEYANERVLPGKIGENTRLIDSFVSPEAVSAAGGCCSLPQPIYDNPVAASLARPIRDSLPTVGVTSRGKVSFFPAVCIATEGADLWTCAEDALVDPDDDTTWKECFEVDCPEEQGADVDAIYSCLGIGNYQARFAPEQWQAHLKAVAALQARKAEVSLFTKMRDGVATTHTVTDTGSIYATFLNGVGLAAAAIRQDQRLVDVRLNLWVADWIRAAIRADLRSRRLGAADTIEATDALIAQALANEGVDAYYSPDIDPIETVESPQTDGALSDFPVTASAVLAPSGYFSFLDGGTLDLGTEIRDNALNRQNKVAAFAESWEGLLARGCNAKALDFPVTVCDNAPCPE